MSRNVNDINERIDKLQIEEDADIAAIGDTGLSHTETGIAVSSDSYVTVYDSGVGDFANVNVDFKNTGLNAVSVKMLGTDPFEVDGEGEIEERTNVAAGGVQGAILQGSSQSFSRFKVQVKRTNAGQSTTISLRIRGQSFE